MLQLENQTPFAATIAALPNQNGIDTLHVIVKGTCTLRPHLNLAETQIPIVRADEYRGDPASSSLKNAAEMHIGKPGTDVLLVGHAWTPQARPAAQSLLTVTVAERRKSIRLFGDRVWLEDGRPGEVKPFTSMPLIWERAFGGVDRSTDPPGAEEHNPVGVGFIGARKPAQMAGQPLPNLEDAAAPHLERCGQRVPPACLAPVAAAWLPRRGFAGTYDEKWQRQRAPYLPTDFDPRFLQCAAPEFAFDRYLLGGEPVTLEGIAPDGPIQFQIPANPLHIEVTMAGSRQLLPANLETLQIEPDTNRASLTWRASLPCDRQLLKVEKVLITLIGAGRST